MSLRNRWHLPIVVVVVLGANPQLAEGAGLCQLSDSEAECRTKVQVATATRLGFDLSDDERLAEEIDKEEADREESQKEEVREQSTGVPNPASLSSAGGSAVSDFLSLLQVSTDSGGLSNDDEAMLIELNDFLGLPTNAGYKVTARLAKAELYEPLAKKITDDLGDGAAELKASLESKFDDLDDVTYSFVYQPPKKTWGRDPKQYSTTFSKLFDSAIARIDGSLSKPWQPLADERDEIVQDYVAQTAAKIAAENPGFDEDQILEQAESTVGDDGLSATFQSVAELLSVDKAARLLELTVAAEEARIERRAALLADLKGTYFFEFSDLVNNQPQFYLRYSVTDRDPMVGPDKKHGRLTYEKGFVNVNRLNKECRTHSSGFEACYRGFFTAGRLAELERGDRISLSIEYTDVGNLDVSIPDTGVSLIEKGDRTIVGSLTYGRYLKLGGDKGGQHRIDLTYNFEDVGRDPNRKDRSVLEVNYSQRVSGDVTFSAGFVWANEPEFRGDVNEELSAKLGLNYKLFRNN